MAPRRLAQGSPRDRAAKRTVECWTAAHRSIEAVAASRAAEPEAPSFDATLAGEASDQQPMAVQAPELSTVVPPEGIGAAWAEEGAAAPSLGCSSCSGCRDRSRVQGRSHSGRRQGRCHCRCAGPERGRARVRAAARQRARCRGQVGSRRQCGSRGLGESEAAAGAPTAQHPRQPCARGSRSRRPDIGKRSHRTDAPAATPSLPLHAVRDGSGRDAQARRAGAAAAAPRATRAHTPRRARVLAGLPSPGRSASCSTCS